MEFNTWASIKHLLCDQIILKQFFSLTFMNCPYVFPFIIPCSRHLLVIFKWIRRWCVRWKTCAEGRVVVNFWIALCPRWDLEHKHTRLVHYTKIFFYVLQLDLKDNFFLQIQHFSLEKYSVLTHTCWLLQLQTSVLLAKETFFKVLIF